MANVTFGITVKDTTKTEGSRATKNAGFNLESDFTGEATLQEFLDFIKASLIRISKEALAEEQVKGFDKNPLVVVDGTKNKPIEAVKSLGKIEFIDSRISATEVVIDIAKRIEELSKIVTGTYIKGNFVFMDGLLIATTFQEVQEWAAKGPKIVAGTVIRFVNVVPYARKLERLGITSGTANVRFTKSKDKQKRSGNYILASNGVYYLASRVASKRYKYNLSVSFRYEFGTTLGIQQFTIPNPRGTGNLGKNFVPPRDSNGQRAKKTKRNSGPYLYPTIKLVFQERGTT